MAVLTEAREASGISQRQLSEQLGRSHNYVNLVERGQRMPNYCEWLEIVEAIGADPAILTRRIVERSRRRGTR